MQEGLLNRRWIGDIKGALTVGALVDYLHLWNALSVLFLQPDIEDKHIFSMHLMANTLRKFLIVVYSMTCVFAHHKQIWRSWAPSKCRFFLWLVAQNKCWTTDHLAKRGMNHPVRCPLFDQDFETIIICWYPAFSLESFGTLS